MGGDRNYLYELKYSQQTRHGSRRRDKARNRTGVESQKNDLCPKASGCHKFKLGYPNEKTNRSLVAV